MRDGHALGLARGARGEDHPAVVRQVRQGGLDRLAVCVQPGGDHEVGAHHGGGLRLLEDGAGALVGVVGVHRHVGRTGQQHAHDRHVEVRRARGDADAHLVAGADAELREARGELGGGLVELVVGEHAAAGGDGGRVTGALDGLEEEVHQGARRGGEVAGAQRVLLGGRRGGGHGWILPATEWGRTRRTGALPGRRRGPVGTARRGVRAAKEPHPEVGLPLVGLTGFEPATP